MLDWNDLRFFLAVVRDGSTLAASRRLRVSQTTVARRIEALERALGVVLFEKLRTGYVATGAASALVEAAERAEASVQAFETSALGALRAAVGTVRMTANELFANQVLVGLLPEFRAVHPQVKLEIETSDRYVDLAAGEADVALRASARPRQAGLVGRHIAPDYWNVYCSRGYAARHGTPANVDEMRDHAVIGIEPGRYGGPIAAWLEGAGERSAIALRRNSIDGLYAAIRGGLGVSMMSELVVRGDAEFVFCFTPEVEQTQELWILTHERLRTVPRVRAVMDFFGRRLSERFRAP